MKGDFTLIGSIFVSELVREFDREDQFDSGINWDGWLHDGGLCQHDVFNDDRSLSIVDSTGKIDEGRISEDFSSLTTTWSIVGRTSFDEFSCVNTTDRLTNQTKRERMNRFAKKEEKQTIGEFVEDLKNKEYENRRRRRNEYDPQDEFHLPFVNQSNELEKDDLH